MLLFLSLLSHYSRHLCCLAVNFLCAVHALVTRLLFSVHFECMIQQIVVKINYRLLRQFVPEEAKIIVRYDIPSNSTVLNLPVGLS